MSTDTVAPLSAWESEQNSSTLRHCWVFGALADGHVFDHAPPQWAHGLVGHGDAPVLSEGCKPLISRQDVLLRYRVGCVASRGKLPRERCSPCTFRTSCDVRLESVMRAKADVRHSHRCPRSAAGSNHLHRGPPTASRSNTHSIFSLQDKVLRLRPPPLADVAPALADVAFDPKRTSDLARRAGTGDREFRNVPA
jgi:hypothetical protein